MTILLAALSFMPILLITLVVHEMGHYLFARWFGLQVNGFQIGAGWRLATLHTGRRTIANREGIPILNPELPYPRPGDTASVYVSRGPDGTYQAEAILPRKTKHRLPREHWDQVRRFNENHPQLTGRVREINQERIVLADMTWSLRAIPLMAGVILAEDPQNRMQGLYNTARWRNKFLITMAGPMANIWFTVMVLMVIATLPMTISTPTAWTVTGVMTGSPAESAGILEGDTLIRVNNAGMASMEEIRREIRKGEATLDLIRERSPLRARVEPEAETGQIGITLAPLVTAHPQDHSMRPDAIAHRFSHISRAYISSLGSLARSVVGREETHGPLVTGPILGAYETALAVQYAGPKAWLIILATINLGIAILNLIPMPPLDGARLLLEGIQALRRGKPLDPQVERAMALGGMAVIWTAGTYLIITDLISIMGK